MTAVFPPDVAVRVQEALRRGLPVPPELRKHLYEHEAARRGLLTYPTFAAFIETMNRGRGAGTLPLLQYEHVPPLVDVAERIVRGELTRVLVLLPTQYLKALADDTAVPTPRGWTTMGALRAGDVVFAGDGTPTRVRAVQHFTEQQTYWVKPEDGEPVRAAHDHLWKVCLPYAGGSAIRTTRSLAENGLSAQYPSGPVTRSVRIPVAGALQLPDVALPIGPYTLGMWLGDGSSRGPAVSCADRDAPEIVAAVRGEGYEVARHPSSRTLACGSYGIYGVGGAWDRETTLLRPLRALNLLKNKHIPVQYFRASHDQRIALLQGLIDSDGTVSARTGRVVFSSTCRRLALDVRHLVHTLGVKAFLTAGRAILNGRVAGSSWCVSFYFVGAARLRRKARRCRDAYNDGSGARTKRARLVRFQCAGKASVTCIAVAHESQTFLVGRSYLVTHNSEIFSRLLPAYYLLQHPERTVALASYVADRAWGMSEEARDYYLAAGGRFRGEGPAGAVRNWRTHSHGGMWAAGVAGPQLGMGYHLGIVDDPVDPEQALSPTYQRRFARWWPSKWLRGQRPGAKTAIVVLMQRLGVEDPIEWLLSREKGRTAERWHVAAFDEIRSEETFWRGDGPRGFPITCTVEPDARAPGTVLAPSYRAADEVARLQATSGPVIAAAQRQQRPMRPTGEFWQRSWFRTYATLPPAAYDGGWDHDTAYGSDQHDSHSANARVYTLRGPKLPTGLFDIYVHDVNWDWDEFPKLVETLMSLAGPHYVERKASGKSVVQALRTYGVPAEEVGVFGGKLERASAAQPAVAAGRLYVREEILPLLLEAERQGLLRVTAEALQAGDAGLDVNDAFVQAIHRHLKLGETKQRKTPIFR